MGKSIKERIKGIKGIVSDVEENMVELGKEQARGTLYYFQNKKYIN